MNPPLRPLRSGYAPTDKQLPTIRKHYQAKLGFFVFSVLIFTLALLGLVVGYTLGSETTVLFGYAIDQTLAYYYAVALLTVSLFITLRASLCVVCRKYRWPAHMDLNGYCDHCGAHLFKAEIYETQKEERSKHDVPMEERLIEIVKRGDVDAIRMLIFKGTNIDGKDRFGNTALITAAMMGKPEIVRLLLDYKADAQATNNFGLNALMMAVDKQHHEVAKILLQVGLSIHKVSKDGRSALDIATEHHDNEMIDLLQQHEV